MKAMKVVLKSFRLLLKVAVFLLVALLIIALAHPVWVGPVVKGVANSSVPKVTKTGFNLGELGVNLYRGRLHVGDVQLQNPERFFKDSAPVTGLASAVAAVGDALSSSETNAVSLTSLDVGMSTMSVLGDTIHVEEIAISGLQFYGDLTFSNIREIAKNAGGDSDESAEPAPGKDEEEQPKKGGEEDKGGKKVVIDRVVITDTKIQWGHVAVPIPKIELKDIGKDSGGTSEEGAFKAIVDGICDAADSVCKGAGSALKLAIEGANSVAEAVGAAADVVKDVAGATTDAMKGAASAATDAMKGATSAATDAMKDATSATTDAMKGATSAATDVVKGAAGATTDAVKGAASATTDAVKGAAGAAADAAGSAVNAVKGLFN